MSLLRRGVLLLLLVVPSVRADVITLGWPIALGFSEGHPSVQDYGASASASNDLGAVSANASEFHNSAAVAALAFDPYGSLVHASACYVVTLADPIHPDSHTPATLSMHVSAASSAQAMSQGGWEVRIADEACAGPIYVDTASPPGNYLDTAFGFVASCTYQLNLSGTTSTLSGGSSSYWSYYENNGQVTFGTDASFDQTIDLTTPVNTPLLVLLVASGGNDAIAAVDPAFSVGPGQPDLAVQVTAAPDTGSGLALDGIPRSLLESFGFDLALFESAGLISAPEPAATALAGGAMAALALVALRTRRRRDRFRPSSDSATPAAAAALAGPVSGTVSTSVFTL